MDSTCELNCKPNSVNCANSDNHNVSINVLQFLGHEGGLLRILEDGHPPSALLFFVLFSQVFGSFTIKAVQKLIGGIIPMRVLLALFCTLVNTGGFVAIPAQHYSLQHPEGTSLISDTNQDINNF